MILFESCINQIYSVRTKLMSIVKGNYGNFQHQDFLSPDIVITVFNPSDNSKNREVKAIFDTGAVMTCLPEKEIEKLGGLNYSSINVRGVNDITLERKTYFVNIQLGDNMFSNIEVVAIPKSYGVIGRDILNSFKVVFDGIDKEWIYACPGACDIEDYHRMIEAGILNNHHLELIAGEIIEMSPKGTFHHFLNHRGVKYLRSILENEAEIMESHPITLLDSEPEPDITIVRSPDTLYLNRHPYPEDIYWLIEIADSTLNKDLMEKKNLYAKFNIPEYWVIDIKNKILYVFQNPQADDYKITKTYQEGIIYMLAFPKVEIDVNKLISLE